MKMYHGTNMAVDTIDLAKSRNRVDFGKGFYLTDKIGTAQSWAIRKVELEGGGIPTILCYEISIALFKLKGQRFPDDPNLEWLDFICSNRRNNPPTASQKEGIQEQGYFYNGVYSDFIMMRLLKIEYNK